MADTYFDATGVLILNKVTPIIQALFGGMNMDADYPGKGEVYIARIYEGGDALWDDICDSLSELAEGLGLPPHSEADRGIETVLERFATYFDVENHEELHNLIEHHEFQDAADLEALFLVATCFDDGHGLKAIILEGAWHCSKPRLFEFGGEGVFISRESVVYSGSSRAQRLGTSLREALLAGKLDEAAQHLLVDANGVLIGIGDPATRALLEAKLAEKLLAQSQALQGESNDQRP